MNNSKKLENKTKARLSQERKLPLDRTVSVRALGEFEENELRKDYSALTKEKEIVSDFKNTLESTMDNVDEPINFTPGNLLLDYSENDVDFAKKVVSNALAQLTPSEKINVCIIDLLGNLGDTFDGFKVINDRVTALNFLEEEYKEDAWFYRGEYATGNIDPSRDNIKVFIVNGLEGFFDQDNLMRSNTDTLLSKVFNQESIRKGTVVLALVGKEENVDNDLLNGFVWFIVNKDGKIGYTVNPEWVGNVSSVEDDEDYDYWN